MHSNAGQCRAYCTMPSQSILFSHNVCDMKYWSMTHWCVWNISFVSSYLWHYSFICAILLVRMYACFSARVQPWNELFARVTDWFTCVTHSHICMFVCFCGAMSWLIRTCDMTHPHVRHDSFVCTHVSVHEWSHVIITIKAQHAPARRILSFACHTHTQTHGYTHTLTQRHADTGAHRKHTHTKKPSSGIIDTTNQHVSMCVFMCVCVCEREGERERGREREREGERACARVCRIYMWKIDDSMSDI